MSVRSVSIRCLEGVTQLGVGRNRLLVLTFHRVLPRPDPMYYTEPDVATFRGFMQALAEDFRILPLAQALQLQREQKLPARSVAVTFDDGFADNVTEALPVLTALQMPATFFIATGYLGGGYMFNDAVIEACRQAPRGVWVTGTAEFGDVCAGEPGNRVGLAEQMISRLKYEDAGRRRECADRLLESVGARMPAGLMMTHEQVRDLRRAGMDVGGHTHGHPILARLSDQQADHEIRQGKADLEDILGSQLALFAYPNGRPGLDFAARDVALVRKAGFSGAVSTAWGYSDSLTDPFQIPRVGSWGRSAWRFSARLALARATARGAVCEPVTTTPAS